MLMVRAGSAVDQTFAQIIPFLEKGDILIDGGNSNWEGYNCHKNCFTNNKTDSNRRMKELNEKEILYIGAGISGGEEGALHGPSIMPGGNHKVSTIAWII